MGLMNIPEPALEPKDYSVPRCPVCDRECEYIYFDKFGDVCGCDECIEFRESWDWADDMKNTMKPVIKAGY